MNPVTTHKTMQKANGIPSEYEWYQQLEARYDNLTEEQFNQLIRDVKETLVRVGKDVPYSLLTANIVKACIRTKEISFNQWKSLSYFVYKHRERKVKSFNT